MTPRKPNAQRCGAKTRSGGTCGRFPTKGATRCKLHGGATPASRRKVQENQEREAARKAMATLGAVPEQNVDPAEALLGLLTQKWAEVQWLRLKVQEVGERGQKNVPDWLEDAGVDTSDMQPDPLVWGQTKREDGVGKDGPVDVSTYEVGPNVWWRLLREAEDQLAKYSAAALRAGVEQRQIELQEGHALHLANAITRILDALGLTQEQARLVPTVVPAVLRELPVVSST